MFKEAAVIFIHSTFNIANIRIFVGIKSIFFSTSVKNMRRKRPEGEGCGRGRSEPGPAAEASPPHLQWPTSLQVPWGVCVCWGGLAGLGGGGQAAAATPPPAAP